MDRVVFSVPTSVPGFDLERRYAGFSRSILIGSNDPELVLHPRIQVCYFCSFHGSIENSWSWKNKKIPDNLNSKKEHLWSNMSPRWLKALTGAGVPPVIFIQSPEVSGLDGVVEDGTVVVCSFGPPKLDPRVPNLFHPDHTGRPRNTLSFTDKCIKKC